MNEFTASNGIGVRLDGRDLDFKNTLDWMGLCGGPVVDALREFFRAEEDERLGRWRWPENTDIYVRPLNERVVGVVKDDAEGLAYSQVTRSMRGVDPMICAGLAYFEAHPEPKPWHDAKLGEAWAIHTNDSQHELLVVVRAVDGGRFEYAATGAVVPVESITGGRRIYPEPS